jgi:Fe-Mn family superoxide dismutase
MRPLPFNPTTLRGLSERLIVSHHENNYGGAVRNLNRTEQELGAVTTATPPLVVVALRERELLFRNSKDLHEAYFGNLGGSGQPSGPVEAALVAAYGSAGTWEQQFQATGLGLGGGSGWVVLALELETGGLRTVGMASHKEALSSALPLLVMDMYEHSYQMDFGAAAARYIEVFYDNVNWDEVNRRFERGIQVSRALRGEPL